MYFNNIRKTEHYKDYHEKHVSWSKVIEIILTTKNRRKKGDKIEIKTKNYYVLCELKNHTLWVINAKQIR